MRFAFFLILTVCVVATPLRSAPEAPATPAPFRLVFKAYDGNPKTTDDYQKFSFQIDTLDRRQPSEFLNLGNWIPNTRLKLLQFVFKEAYNAKIQEKEDVSELTVINPATGKTAVLPLNKVVDVSGIYSPPTPANK